MSRERVVELALRAYPCDVRDDLGAEMASTALDAGADARELAGLVRAGLRMRATRTASVGPRRLVADGLCLAAVWLMTLDLSTLLAQRARGLQDPLLAWPSIALLAAALALALVGYDRIAGAAALAWTAARLPALLEHDAMLAATVLPVVCFATLVLVPRRRRRDLHRLVWLVVPVTLVAALGPPHGEQSPVLLAIVGLGALLVAVAAIALMPIDPRLAIAAAVPLSTLGLGVAGHEPYVFAALLISAAPLAVSLAIARSVRLRL